MVDQSRCSQLVLEVVCVRLRRLLLLRLSRSALGFVLCPLPRVFARPFQWFGSRLVWLRLWWFLFRRMGRERFRLFVRVRGLPCILQAWNSLLMGGKRVFCVVCVQRKVSAGFPRVLCRK